MDITKDLMKIYEFVTAMQIMVSKGGSIYQGKHAFIVEYIYYHNNIVVLN